MLRLLSCLSKLTHIREAYLLKDCLGRTIIYFMSREKQKEHIPSMNFISPLMTSTRGAHQAPVLSGWPENLKIGLQTNVSYIKKKKNQLGCKAKYLQVKELKNFHSCPLHTPE